MLRLDPDALLKHLCQAWASAYEHDLTRRLAAGAEASYEPAPLPDDLVDETALYAALAVHDRHQDWRRAALEGDIDALRCAERAWPREFADGMFELLDAAIGHGQLETLQGLLLLARTPHRHATLDMSAVRRTALTLAAQHRQEAALALLLNDGADPAAHDAAFWRLNFPDGTADPRIEYALVERVPGYGVARLAQAAQNCDWARSKAILDHLDMRTRQAKEEEAAKAQAFITRLRQSRSRPRSPAVLVVLVELWRQLAAGRALKAIAPDVKRSVSQLSRLRAELAQHYRAVYGGPARFGSVEAHRVQHALHGKPLGLPFAPLWSDRNEPRG